jgi:hypothetical protein
VSLDLEGFGFVVNLINQTITFDGGYTASLTRMLDQHFDETDDNSKVRFISFAMPPDGMVVSIDLDLIEKEEIPAALH